MVEVFHNIFYEQQPQQQQLTTLVETNNIINHMSMQNVYHTTGMHKVDTNLQKEFMIYI
jgi:hypothetical protein